MRNLSLTALGLLASALSFAGNGSSGGGHIHGDQLNPWFLSNTTEVTYCLEISKDFSRIPEPKLRALVAEAFDYWKEEFAQYPTDRSSEVEEAGFEVKLATQNFKLSEACTPSVDIRFQLGSLSPEQLLKIPNYKQTIGLASRTSYDTKSLRGSGFIYVAPEAGQLRPSSVNMHPKPWSSGTHQALRYTLIHEIGHVFGLQDDHYSSYDLDIMSAKFVEAITSTRNVNYLSRKSQPRIPSVFGCNTSWTGDSGVVEYDVIGGEGPNELDRFLGLLEKKKLRFVSQNKKLEVLDVTTGTVNATVDLGASNADFDQSTDAIALYLTSEQTVFARFPRRLLTVSNAIFFRSNSVIKKGLTLKVHNGNTLPVFVSFDQACAPTVGGVFKGEVFFDLYSGY